MKNEDARREEEWRQLAMDLYTRLAACQPVKLGNVTALPRLPTDDELQQLAHRFRVLSAAGGWSTEPKPKRRWWPFR